MDNVVAVRVILDDERECFFMTWGRIQHPTDPAELERLILSAAISFGTNGKPKTAQLCGSLRDASQAPYFYEALISFSQKQIPFGEKYENWKNDVAARMMQGKDIYFLGMD